jgi:hypothetical protein
MQRKTPFLGGIEHLTKLSYTTLFALWILLAFGFGLAYFALSVLHPEHGPIQLIDEPDVQHKLLNAFYYSWMTATSTGYGDITPHGFSKFLAAVQSVFALIVFGIFITKLVSQKQELALQEVHRLTFEDGFHNTREGLYIARKDIDRVMEKIELQQRLDSEDWADLVIAYQQIQTLISEIPDFYANDEEENPARPNPRTVTTRSNPSHITAYQSIN